MPVSPQDFALWSNMTGNPYPRTPAERMALAPEVYSYTRQIGRQGGPNMSPVRRAVDVVGKAALAAGAIAGAGYLASKGFQKLDLDNEPDIGSTVSEAMPNAASSTARAASDITPSTTSDNYAQDLVPHQTSVVQALRGTTSQKPTLGTIEQKPATQSQVISAQQHFAPGAEEQQLASAAQPSPSVREKAEELIGKVSAAKVAQFRQSPSYAATVKPLESAELVGDDTPFEAPYARQSSVLTQVKATPKTRIAVSREESPIAEMSSVAAPVAARSAAPQRQTAAEMEDERLARMAFGNMPIEQAKSLLAKARGAKEEAPAAQSKIVTTSQPEAVRVSSELKDVTSKLMRQAKAMRTNIAEAGGAMSQDIPSGPIHNITVFPHNEVAVTYKTKAGTQTYNFDADPGYVGELAERLQKGSFVKGMDSAGGFIQAGRSMGLLK